MSEGSTAKRSRRCLKNGKDVSASYRESEERVRQAREKLDEERMKKIDDIKQASLAHQRYRGQLEEQRKRRIDDVRTRNNERQSAVLERRRQILEAEMDQRKALLRRKLERGAELEAKKNAQRNAMPFAFGSGSTPRLYESYGIAKSPKKSASLNRNFNGSASKPMRAKSATNTDKTHEQDVSTAPSKSPSPDLHIEVQASGDNVNVMASKPDIVPDETLVNAPATDQPFAEDDKSLSPNHDKAELEQIRLAEEHRQLEEETLLKAIEDKEKKDEEEQKIKE